jgi:DNA-binding MarR family transcriptional regulator/GNAT superfamily N-acetyltransferase
MDYLTKATNPVDAVRRFNRFYTGRIGILPEDYLGSSHSLAEARVIFELGARKSATATELGREMDVDLGYLSRLVQGLKRRGLLSGRRSPEDARRTVLALTPKGQKTFQALDARSRKEIGEILGGLSAGDRGTLVGAMGTVERLLGGARKGELTLRPHRPGDMGYVVEAHGRLYSEEYGWDERFEALVAGIVSEYVAKFDPARERCWIAELDGERIGSVFLKKVTKTKAKLRLLIVDPRARGLGVGRRLVKECIAFARAKGYREMVLWTQSNLAAARHIYREEGFRLLKSYRHREFGYDLTGEYWTLKLS